MRKEGRGTKGRSKMEEVWQEQQKEQRMEVEEAEIGDKQKTTDDGGKILVYNGNNK